MTQCVTVLSSYIDYIADAMLTDLVSFMYSRDLL